MSLDKIHQVPILHVRGSNYTVGYSIGRTFKSLIEDFIKKWAFFHDVLLPAYENQNGKQIYEGCLQHCRDKFPQYVKELEGMAEGAEVPFHHLFLLHIESLISPVIEEPSSFYNSANGPPATGLMGCTSLICNGSQPVLGHTEDAAPEMTNSFFIVCAEVTEDDDDETVIEQFSTLTYPGYLPGYTMGYNSHGIVYSVNTIVPAKTYPERTPVHFICRAFMGKKSFEEIQDLLKDEGTGIADGFSLNLVIVKDGQTKAWNIEIGPNQNSEAVSEVSAVPVDAGTPSVHCNKYLRLTHPQQEGGGRQSSKWRMEAISKMDRPDDVEGVKRILSDRSNEKFPVFREAAASTANDNEKSGEEKDYASTIATGIFDLSNMTWSIYTRPSAESRPIVVIPMKFN